MTIKTFFDVTEQIISKIYNYFERHFFLTLILLFLISLVVKLSLTPYHIVLKKDAFAYLIHALQMVNGDFTPRLDAALGWPLFLSPFLYLFGSKSIFQNMVYARVLSNFVGALSIFPLAYIGRKLLDSKSLLFLLVLFTFTSELIMTSILALTEPLFIFFLLMCVLFIIKSMENQRFILLASLFGALAYYVRSNGFIILFIILLSFFFLRKHIPQFKYRYLVYSILIFFIVSAPFLYQRDSHFGSAFFYGESYFIDSDEKLHSSNLSPVTLIDYLKTHTFGDYLNKFFIRGVVLLLVNFFNYVVPLPLLFFFLFGFIKHLLNKQFLPLTVTCLVWIISFVPVWDIIHSPRLFYPIIPFILIFSTIAISELFKDYKYKHLLLSLFLIIFIISSLITPALYLRESLSNKQDELEWGKWISQNVKGKIVMFNSDAVMIFFPDVHFGNRNEFVNLYSLKANLSITQPGYFTNLDSAMNWFKKINATYIAIDEETLERKPYFKEIITGKKVRTDLTEVYSNYNTSSKWKIKVYKIK